MVGNPENTVLITKNSASEFRIPRLNETVVGLSAIVRFLDIIFYSKFLWNDHMTILDWFPVYLFSR